MKSGQYWHYSISQVEISTPPHFLFGKISGLFHRHNYKMGGQGEKKTFHSLVNSPNGCSSLGWVTSTPRVSSTSPQWMQGPKHIGHSPLPFRVINRELSLKWICQDKNQRPHGTPALQTMASAASSRMFFLHPAWWSPLLQLMTHLNDSLLTKTLA